jgi:hypothetical protein
LFTNNLFQILKNTSDGSYILLHEILNIRKLNTKKITQIFIYL